MRNGRNSSATPRVQPRARTRARPPTKLAVLFSGAHSGLTHRRPCPHSSSLTRRMGSLSAIGSSRKRTERRPSVAELLQTCFFRDTVPGFTEREPQTPSFSSNLQASTRGQGGFDCIHIIRSSARQAAGSCSPPKIVDHRSHMMQVWWELVLDCLLLSVQQVRARWNRRQNRYASREIFTIDGCFYPPSSPLGGCGS
jgi:hypothetical protein